MTMEAAARALGSLERDAAVCDQLLAPLKRMTALQVGHPWSRWRRLCLHPGDMLNTGCCIGHCWGSYVSA